MAKITLKRKRSTNETYIQRNLYGKHKRPYEEELEEEIIDTAAEEEAARKAAEEEAARKAAEEEAARKAAEEEAARKAAEEEAARKAAEEEAARKAAEEEAARKAAEEEAARKAAEEEAARKAAEEEAARKAAEEEARRKLEELQREQVSAQEVKEIISDEIAEVLIETEEETEKIFGNKKGIINLDVIARNYEAGEEVTVNSLKAKHLIDKNICFIKVLARGTIDKPLTVKAQDFSIDAAKMIELTGGRVVMLTKRKYFN